MQAAYEHDRNSDLTQVLGNEHDLHARVSAEFREMPGLSLTVAQAARLFSLDRERCERVLGVLVERGVLFSDGRAFARVDSGRRYA